MILDSPTIKIFKIKKSKSFLAACYAVLFSAGTLACLYASVDVVIDGVSAVLILTLPSALLFGIAAWAQLEDLTNKLVVEPDKFFYSTAFGSRSIDFSDIKGYRYYVQRVKYKSESHIEIHPVKGGIISLKDDINDFIVLQSWLGQHFHNLTSLLKVDEMKEMMENPALGVDKDEREKFIGRARIVSYFVNGLGIVAAGLLFVLDLSVFTAALALLVYPVSVVVVVYHKGVIYYNNKTDSEHPYVGLGLLAISFGLFAKGIQMGSELVSFSAVPWLLITLAAVGLVLIMLATTREFAMWTSMDIGNVGAFLFFFWLMSLGSFVITNHVMDNSQPKEVKTTVTGKSAKTYSVDFEPAGEVIDKEAVVDEKIYNKIKKGDTITLQIFSGKWGSAWYRVGEEKK